LGGTNVVTDETGELVQLIDYYPFGDVRLNEQLTDYNEQNKFTGHELDQTGLYYANARYYDPKVKWFVSVDPVVLNIGTGYLHENYDKELTTYLQEPQNLNSYSYVTNNPLMYIDPNGELKVKDKGASDEEKQKL